MSTVERSPLHAACGWVRRHLLGSVSHTGLSTTGMTGMPRSRNSLQALRWPATAASWADGYPAEEYGVVARAAVNTASRSALFSSDVTLSRHCVHAAPNAPGVARGVVFQG